MIFESSFNLNCKLGLKMFNFRLNNDEIEYNLQKNQEQKKIK